MRTQVVPSEGRKAAAMREMQKPLLEHQAQWEGMTFEDFSDWYWRKVNLRRAERILNIEDLLWHLENKCRCGNNGGGDCDYCQARFAIELELKVSPHPLAATDGGLGDTSGAVRLLSDKLAKQCGELQAIIQAEIERINKL